MEWPFFFFFRVAKYQFKKSTIYDYHYFITEKTFYHTYKIENNLLPTNSPKTKGEGLFHKERCQPFPEC